MADFMEILVVGVVTAAIILITVPLTTLIGAIIGMATGWFFGDTILYVLARAGIINISMWQLGATLGFVAGFFVKSDSK